MIQTPIHDVKVIVVDDTPEIRDLVVLMMKMFLNREVQGFCNGLEAWEHIQENTVHIIISDVNMPFMDGIELLRKVREKFGKNITFISMSGIKENAKALNELGVDCFIAKPISIADFVTVVKRFITGEI